MIPGYITYTLKGFNHDAEDLGWHSNVITNSISYTNDKNAHLISAVQTQFS